MRKISPRTGIILTSIGALALLFTSLTNCGPGRFGDRGDGPCFRGKWHPPRFAGKDPSEWALKRLDGHVESLNLTEVQKARYGEIRKKLESQLREGMEKRADFMREVSKEMVKDSPDLQSLAVRFKEGSRRLPEFMDRNIDLFLEFYSILDDAQKARVIEHFKEKFEKRRPA